MANELTISASLACVNGNHEVSASVSRLQFTQNTQGGVGGVSIIGTSEETLTEGDVSTEGWIFLRNLDATNYIELGFSTGVYGVRLKAGEVALFRVNPSSTIYVKANVASCKLYYELLED